MTAHLRNWSVQPDPYKSPEQQSGSNLVGNIHGAEDYEDGMVVRLGRVVSVAGCVLTFADGLVVEFVDPQPEYLEWMESQGMEFDPEEPFKLIDTNSNSNGVGDA